MLIARFYLRQLIKALAGFVGGLVLVDFIFRFVDYLELAARSQLTPDDVWKMLVLKLGVGTTELAPLAMLLATFSVILGLRRSNEYTAILAGGFPAVRLLRITLTVALFSALSSGLITLYLKPEAETRAYEIRTRSANEADVAGIEPGVFRPLQNGSIFFAEGISPDSTALESAFLTSPDGTNSRVSHSARAFVNTAEDGERTAIFESGVNYAGEIGMADYTITRFDRQVFRLEGTTIHSPRGHEKFARTPDLIARPTPAFAAELHWRLGLPLAILISAMVSFVIAIRTPPQDWHLALITAVAIYFLYKNLLSIGRSLIKDASIPAALGLWWVHLLVLVPTLVLLWLKLRPGAGLKGGLRRLIPAPLR